MSASPDALRGDDGPLPPTDPPMSLAQVLDGTDGAYVCIKNRDSVSRSLAPGDDARDSGARRPADITALRNAFPQRRPIIGMLAADLSR